MPDIYQPVFLLGTQRSGTTLLSRILSAHSQLYIQNEIPLTNVFNPPLDKEKVVDRIVQKIDELHAISIPEMVGQGTLWGLKEPYLTFHLDSLRSLFPDSKFLLIVRDPRAVAISYIDNKWGLGTNCFTAAERWNDEVRLQWDFTQQDDIDRLVLKFEDLVADTRSQLEKICDFLEIGFDEKMLEYHRQKADFSVNKSNINTFKKIDKNKANRYSERFTERQLGIIQGQCDEMMHKLNYPVHETSVKPGFLEQLYYRWHQKIIGKLQFEYQWKKFRVREILRDYRSKKGELNKA